jgi:hypothetical protein
MTRGRLFLVSTMAIGMLGANALAQVRPNLSGEWKLIPGDTAASPAPRARPGATAPEPAASGPSRSGGVRPGDTAGGAFQCGSSCTITHVGRTLKIQQHVTAPATAPPEIVLSLTGNESKTLHPRLDGGTPVEYTMKAQWDGNRLLVTRTLGTVVKIDQVISLQAGNLTIVTTPHFEGMKPIVWTYKKQ